MTLAARRTGLVVRARAAALGAALAATLALPGCSVRELLWGAGVPWWTAPATVTAVAAHGPYLEATLRTEAFELAFLFPNTPTCRRVLEADATVEYTRLRLFGRVSRNGEECDPIGTASLARWRDLRPRGDTLLEPAVPRAQATFRVIHSDEEVILLRGRFPLAERLGFTSWEDLVAAVPNVPLCEGPAREGVATMEFRHVGRVALALVGSDGLCPVRGLALPPPPEAAAGAAAPAAERPGPPSNPPPAG